MSLFRPRPDTFMSTFRISYFLHSAYSPAPHHPLILPLRSKNISSEEEFLLLRSGANGARNSCKTALKIRVNPCQFVFATI